MMKILEAFFQTLYHHDWDTIKTHQDTNEAYDIFILTFCRKYFSQISLNLAKDIGTSTKSFNK